MTNPYTFGVLRRLQPRSRMGAGEIGGRVARMLAGFDVEVTTVRRRPVPGSIGPDAWRARLHEFDWVIIAVPATPDTSAAAAATMSIACISALRDV